MCVCPGGDRSSQEVSLSSLGALTQGPLPVKPAPGR